MDYLARESAPFGVELWDAIDKTVVETARRTLTGRRFLSLFGPLGAGVQNIHIDDGGKTEEAVDGIVITKGRRYAEIPQLYEDFTLSWRDLEVAEKSGYPFDLSAVTAAAQAAAKKEDHFIFWGNEALGYEGLLNAAGVNQLKRSDWKAGENPFTDVATGVMLLAEKGITGRLALVVSPDLYVQLQRLQASTGLLEADRLGKLLNGNLYQTAVLGKGRAVLVCAEPQNMDLVIGQDLITSYLELKDLNHGLRILETVLLRIKNKEAVVVFQ